MAVAFLAVVGIIGFIYKMLNTREPIVDFTVLKKGNLAIGVVLQFILGFVLFGSVFVLPLFMQRFLGFTATDTGAIFIPGALLSGLSMPLVGRVLQNGLNPKHLIVVGFSLTAIFVGWISFILTSTTSEAYFFWPLLIRGIGMGFIFVPISNLALAGLQGRDLTQASGLMNMIRQIGGSLSVAIIGVLTETMTAQHRNDLLPNISASNPNVNDSFNALVANFSRFTSDINIAQQQAYSFMERRVFAQASVLTYVDILQYITLFILICIPLILMARTIKAKPPGADAGVH
jgi:DHA2 family multidrug resistance protein